MKVEIKEVIGGIEAKFMVDDDIEILGFGSDIVNTLHHLANELEIFEDELTSGLEDIEENNYDLTDEVYLVEYDEVEEEN